jgi:type VI protein secretion system component Hcp
MIVMSFGDGAIEGECTVSGYEGYIVLEDASFNLVRHGVEIGGGTAHRKMGKAYLGELNASMESGASSAELFAQAAGGDDRLDNAEILWLEESAESDKAKEVRLKLVLSEPMITSYALGGDPARDTITIGYTGLTIFPYIYKDKSWVELSEKKFSITEGKMV